MNLKLVAFLLLTLAVTFFSCKDFIETDISEKIVYVYTPADSTETTVSTQTFLWKEVEGAIKYNIQIVNGTFTSIQNFVADTNLVAPKFIATLQPGKYQWRIKALNSTSSTTYQVYNLQVDSTENLSNQIIVLSSPSNNSYTNKVDVNLTWSGLYNATEYHLQVTSTDFTTTSGLELDTFVIANSFVFKSPADGNFKWRVKAINNSSESPFSAVSTIIIDTEKPETPVLLLPQNNEVFSNAFKLYWDRGTVSGSTISDSVFIYLDSLVTLVDQGPFFTSGTSYSDSTLASGTYFWRVRSIDAAGNRSGFSSARKFRIQ